MVKTLEDIIEPDTDDEKRFNLSIKQLSFIQNDNNIKFMNNIMKLMKQYKLEVEDVNNIIEKHVQTEEKRLQRNETRRLQKQQEKNKQNDYDSEDDVKSNKRSSKRSKKRSSKRK